MSSNKLRMTGLISGMDTDSIISALVSNRQLKVDKAKKEQTKLGWKQDLWKDINKQIASFQGEVANMRFSTAFAKKTTKVSNSNKASVITGDNAVNSVQSLKVNSLAKTAYLTGGTVETKSGEEATAMTKLSDLGFEGNGSIDIETSKGKASIDVNSNTTINDLLTKLKDQGLNANFDAKTQRLFISAKESGKAAQFTVSSKDADGNDALAKLGLQNKSYFAGLTSVNDADVNATVSKKLDSYVKSYNELKAQELELSAKINDTADKISKGELLEKASDYDDAVKTAKENLDKAKAALDSVKREDYDSEEAYEQIKKDRQQDIDDMQKAYDDIKAKQDEVANYVKNQDELTSVQGKIADIEKNLTNIQSTTDTDENGKEIITYTADASDALKADVKKMYDDRIADAAKIDDDSTKFATMVKGEDASITLNGAKFTGSSNVFNINGLTITALGTTADDEEITLTTENDTTGIYDMVKKFVSSYNSVVNKLYSLYNADAAKGYEPLTEDEKEAMSEKEVEKYEQKIKDSLLRRDSDVSNIMNALTEITSQSMQINGKNFSLASFGIATQNFFSAPEGEKYALHIDGDADDSVSSGNADKLKNLITNDPDSLVSFFTKLSQDLYKKMDNMSKSVNGYRSFGSFYDDKKMKEDYDSYKTKITDLEDKVNAYEDKLYKQYTAMEKAMAKLQSSTSGLGSLMGSSK